MRVVAVAGDAGGARAVLPVIRALVRAGVSVECRAYAAATAVWRAAGLASADPRGSDLAGVDGLVLGTTVGPEQLEPEYVRSAADRGIRSVSIVDAWVSYRERFLARDGLVHWPDRIAVADDEMRDGVIAAGAPRDRVVVTGQPAFDDLAPLATPEGREAARARVRAALGVAATELLVLFASQPLHQLHTVAQLGFDDRAVLGDVIRALHRVLVDHGRTALLVVKLHPREMSDPPPGPEISGDGLRAIVLGNDRIAPRELAAAADLVVGMSSILLVEACFVRTPALSYQPELRAADPLPTNRRGWSRAVTRRSDLEPAIAEELLDPASRQARQKVLANARVDGHAAGRVAKIVMAH